MVYDITLTGIGIGGFELVTMETLEAIKTARVILDLSSHHRRLKEYCRHIIRVDELYWSGELDVDTYRKIADVVLAEARNGPRVVYVEDGHPAFYDDVTWAIYRRGKKAGLKVRILPAISSIDSMIANCDLEIGGGFQIFEATSLVAFNQEINPRIDLLVMQVGWFGTSLMCEVSSSKRDRFQPLVDYLRKSYPANHPVRILKAPMSKRASPLVFSTKLGSLDRYRRRITSETCLFIPRLKNYPEPNEDFIAATEDRGHLLTIAALE